ncbi:hypothetical protein ABZ953_23225 [Streptomyces sp. NPDC046465]|uniref:hypothetical protein n=1 Tax=Streptomyces sp. NPDC046465 TaxID=3155810 RepID=UPI0033C25CF6
MSTVERHRASGSGAAVGGRDEAAARSPGPRSPAAQNPVQRNPAQQDPVRRRPVPRWAIPEHPEPPEQEHEQGQEFEQAVQRPPLWVEEPARRRRLPDPVRTAAVRAVIIVAVTLVQAMIAVLAALAGSWLSFPMVLSSVASTVVATWGVLDVWVTRQVWNQRHGVVSVPSSTARRLRRERRRARRQSGAAARGKERIQGRGGSGQLSHP